MGINAHLYDCLSGKSAASMILVRLHFDILTPPDMVPPCMHMCALGAHVRSHVCMTLTQCQRACNAPEVFIVWQADTLQRRMFYVPSFKIYGAVAGFYDYGPPGCAVKQNLTALWRKHFVLEENMLEARPVGRMPCMLVESCMPPWLAGEVHANASFACIGTTCTVCAKANAAICGAAAAHRGHC